MFYNLSDKGKTKKDYKQNSRNKFQFVIGGVQKRQAAGWTRTRLIRSS